MSNTNANIDKENGSAPIFQIKAGGIKAAVFENKTDKGNFKTIKLSRVYKDGNDFKYTNNLDVDDLPKAILVLEQVYEQLILKDTTNEK